jgi:hypothetical protein
LVQPRDPHLREGVSILNRRASRTVACWHSGLCGVHRRVPRATPLGITDRASLGVGRPRVSLEGAGASADTQIAQSLVRSRECRPTSENPPWTKFRLCEVALLDHCPRSAHHGSGAWATGCFQTHVSARTPPQSINAPVRKTSVLAPSSRTPRKKVLYVRVLLGSPET